MPRAKDKLPVGEGLCPKGCGSVAKVYQNATGRKHLYVRCPLCKHDQSSDPEKQATFFAMLTPEAQAALPHVPPNLPTGAPVPAEPVQPVPTGTVPAVVPAPVPEKTPVGTEAPTGTDPVKPAQGKGAVVLILTAVACLTAAVIGVAAAA
jgi:hypothetical protein